VWCAPFLSRPPDCAGDDESGGGAGNKKQFLNKRAGHYNEYKVLQAMRAKLAAEQDEDEDD
jgi:hypothetical protein